MPNLKVRANPERGAVLHEMALDRFVGAVVDLEKLTKSKKYHFVFADASVEVPFTAYYRRCVLDGDLLAADAETAKLCGAPFDAKKHADLDAKAKKSKEDAVKAAKSAAKESAKGEGSQPS